MDNTVSNREPMDWLRLMQNVRLGQEQRRSRRHDDRTEFRRDYDRLIFSAPFRRMQNKTQVFPLPGSVFVHNRLTHSLEVSSVGMSLATDVTCALLRRHPELAGTNVEEIGSVVSAACLAHDMGNPPFGHSGEAAIRAFFLDGKGRFVRDLVGAPLWNDITHFEGNANAFRLLTHRFSGRREGGFVMTYATLASMVKYPFSSFCAGKRGKFGFFHTEEHYYRRIADTLGIIRLSGDDEPARYVRHPLVYLVEAADDICYEIMDIEDANKLRLLSFEQTSELLLNFFDDATKEQILRRIKDEGVTDDNEKVVYLRSCVIGKLKSECAEAFLNDEEKILRGAPEGALLEHVSDRVRTAYERCKAVSVRKIYDSKPVLDVELGGYKIMETLLSSLIYAAVDPDTYHSRQLRKRFSSQYEITSGDLETRIMAVIDFISGMTDVFALDIYQKITGASLPMV